MRSLVRRSLFWIYTHSEIAADMFTLRTFYDSVVHGYIDSLELRKQLMSELAAMAERHRSEIRSAREAHHQEREIWQAHIEALIKVLVKRDDGTQRVYMPGKEDK